MPSFYKEVEAESEFIDAGFDITVDEFLSECDNYDIDEVIEWLRDSQLLKEKGIDINRVSATESFYEEAINKLHGNWNRLTKEQEDTILNIANKL